MNCNRRIRRTLEAKVQGRFQSVSACFDLVLVARRYHGLVKLIGCDLLIFSRAARSPGEAAACAGRLKRTMVAMQRRSKSGKRGLAGEETPSADITTRAGVVAQRMLVERGLHFLEDLSPDDARELLRAAWREAAAQMFRGPDLDVVRKEIDIMIDSLDMTEPAPPMPRSQMN
jgi:hypothetical protein